jgi:hypothetical protein
MKTKSTNRRNFLLAAGLGGAGAVAALTTAQKTRVAGEAAPPADKADGYRASAHILKYYKTTEV